MRRLRFEVLALALCLVGALGAVRAAWAQTGACGPGLDCQTNSLTTPSIGYGRLPTCGATTRRGNLRFTTDAGYVQCIAGAWSQVGAGAVTTESLTASTPLVLTDDGGTVNLTYTPTYKLVGFVPSTGLPWDGTSTRTTIALGQPWTATHMSGIFSAGTGGGTTPVTIKRTLTGADDGGVCVATVTCASPCPDAGAVCSIPFTGECQFAATQVVWPTAVASGCTTYPATAGFNIYGTTQ